MDHRDAEQEIKELQAGLGTVVQALNFLVTFLESDYGLKFQFQAYCNSPPHSHNSNVLEAVKQRFGNLGTGNATSSSSTVNSNDNGRRPYQRQQSCHPSHSRMGEGVGGSAHGQLQQSIRLQNREVVVGSKTGNATNLATSPGTGTAESLSEQDLSSTISVANVINEPSSHHHPPSTMVDGSNANVEGAPPVYVNDGGMIFSIDDLSAVVKEESHPDPDQLDDFMQGSDAEAQEFGKSELEDEGDSDPIPITHNNGGHLMGHQNSVLTMPSAVKTVGKVKRKYMGKLKEGFKCPHCRRRCPDMAKLQLHMAHHTEQFRCSECGVGFAGKAVLKRHMRTHTGDRPFSCGFCQETFARQDILKKHIQRKHKPTTGELG